MKTFFIILGSLIALFIITIIGAFFYAKSSNSKVPDPAKSNLITIKGFDTTKVDSIYKYSKHFPNHSQIAIGMIKGDSVSYYGILRDTDTLYTISNKDSVFQIGSITKVFNSTLLADFIINENIDPKKPIQEHLDIPLNSIEKEGSFITLENLSNHTSGLPRLPDGMLASSMLDPDKVYENFTEDNFEDYLKNKMQPITKPGSKMSYSNLGAGLISYTLSKISNKKFEELLQNRIFQKYNMKNSSTLRENIGNLVVKGRDNQGNVTPSWKFSSMRGAGAIYSNVEDLSKFMIANFSNDTILGLQRKPTFEINPERSVGLGWMIDKKNDAKWYWHNGATQGYRSCMILDTRNKRGVVVLSNINAFYTEHQKIDKLCFKLMSVL